MKKKAPGRLTGRNGKKGQYRLIFEVILILVGILMTAYVLSNFDRVRGNVARFTIEDGFNAIANEVLIGFIKASANNGTAIRLDIPETTSNHVYAIKVDGVADTVTVVSLTDPTISVTRKIFNIGQVNRIINSEIVSSARVVEVVSESGTIRMRRGI